MAAADPAPELVNLTIPPTVRPGQEFEVVARATNRGDAARNGSVSVSFAGGVPVRILESTLGPGPQGTVGSGSNVVVLQPGDRAYNFKLGQGAPLSSTLAELYVEGAWAAGQERFLRLSVTAPAGRPGLQVQVRVTARDQSGRFFHFQPVGAQEDQQGAPALTRQVQVADPTPTPPPPPPTPVPPTPLPPTATPPPATRPPSPTATQPPAPPAAQKSATEQPTATRTPTPGASGAPAVVASPGVTPTGASGDARSPSDPNGSPWMFLVLAAVLGVAGVGVGALLVSRRRAPAPPQPVPSSTAPIPAAPGPTPPISPGLGASDSTVIYPSPPPWAPYPTPAGTPYPPPTPPGTPRPTPGGQAGAWTGSAGVTGYQIVDQPKRGGMALVYKAYQPSLDRYVALKVLSPALSGDPSFVQRFHDEARRTASLNHPSIVTIYDIGNANGSAFIAMRYVHGVSLQEMLARDGRLPTARAAAIAIQVADALQYAHSRGVIHRDVKPGNIMIEPVDRVTLTDFGIARVIGETRLTRTGAIVGTPEYLSPEQATASSVDHRSDLYALGVVLYEMVTGHVPFQADTPIAVAFSHAYTPPPPPSQFVQDIPPGLVAIIMKALAKDPAERFQSGRELAEALRQVLLAESR